MTESETNRPYARYHRMLGQDVFFMTGADEHGSWSQLAQCCTALPLLRQGTLRSALHCSSWMRVECCGISLLCYPCHDTSHTSYLSRSLHEAKDCSSGWEWGPAANPDLWPLLFSPQRRLILWEPVDGLRSLGASLLALLAVSHCILHSPLQLVHKSILKACLSDCLFSSSEAYPGRLLQRSLSVHKQLWAYVGHCQSCKVLAFERSTNV